MTSTALLMTSAGRLWPDGVRGILRVKLIRLEHTTMRTIEAMIVALGLAVAAPSVDQGGPFIQYGGSGSCGAFSAATGPERLALEEWLLGFLSGVGWARGGAGGPAMARTDADGALGWVIKHCAENPLKTFSGAVISLVHELESRAK